MRLIHLDAPDAIGAEIYKIAKCNGGPYLVPAGTAIRMADTPILPYLEYNLIVTIILKLYLKYCTFCLGIIFVGLLVLLDSKSNNLTSRGLSNAMILNRGTTESNRFLTVYLFQGILFLS